MHIVLLNQYYPPASQPTGLALQDVATRLVQCGHHVTVLCADFVSPSGNTADADGALDIIRLEASGPSKGDRSGKLVSYLLYYARAAAWLLRPRLKYDRVVALSTPPYLSILARFVSRIKGGDHAHWVMDVYPDVMVADGMIAHGGMMHGLLRRLAKWGMGGRRSFMILTLGPDMASLISEVVGKSDTPINWVPLWSNRFIKPPEEGDVDDLREARGWRDEETVFMYSGNMGRGHDFKGLMHAIESLHDHDEGGIRFVFYGEGFRRAEMDLQAAKLGWGAIEVHDPVPDEDLSPHIRSADVHFILLDSAWSGMMLPSKLQGVFASARPVIFIGCVNSLIAKWVRDANSGWVVAPGDQTSLKQAIAEARIGEARRNLGRNAALYAESHFDRARNATRVAEFFGAETINENE